MEGPRGGEGRAMILETTLDMGGELGRVDCNLERLPQGKSFFKVGKRPALVSRCETASAISKEVSLRSGPGGGMEDIGEGDLCVESRDGTSCELGTKVAKVMSISE